MISFPLQIVLFLVKPDRDQRLHQQQDQDQDQSQNQNQSEGRKKQHKRSGHSTKFFERNEWDESCCVILHTSGLIYCIV